MRISGVCSWAAQLQTQSEALLLFVTPVTPLRIVRKDADEGSGRSVSKQFGHFFWCERLVAQIARLVKKARASDAGRCDEQTSLRNIIPLVAPKLGWHWTGRPDCLLFVILIQ